MIKIKERHKTVIMGVELEGYTILIPSHTVSRKMAFHRKGIGEKGERFTRDWSIGTEYNSRPFITIREGLFLLKAGLRKYNTQLYRTKSRSRQHRQILLVGGWNDRFAGAHIHLSFAERKLTPQIARKLGAHLHAHLPLLIAISSNSPVWGCELTESASNRVMKGSKTYFKPITRTGLGTREFDEMLYSRGRKTKPPTLEVRVMDSNIPEYVMVCACIIKACTLAFLRGKPISSKVTQLRYLRSRIDAAKHGMKAKLFWNDEKLPAGDYLDRFVWHFREELKEMDIPQEIWTTMKLLKRGFNGSHVLSLAAKKSYRHHAQTWERRFAKRYVDAIHSLLGGNSLKDFIKNLEVSPPDVSHVWLGRRKLKLL